MHPHASQSHRYSFDHDTYTSSAVHYRLAFDLNIIAVNQVGDGHKPVLVIFVKRGSR